MLRTLRPLRLLLVLLLGFLLSLPAFAADPTFSNKQIKLGFSAADVVTADFNRDGKPDLAILGPSSVAVLIGNGDGTFRRTDYAAGAGGGLRLVVADFNGDKAPDLATSDKNGDLIIFFNKGDGTFQNAFGYKLSFANDGKAPDFTAADFDGDGKADLAYTLNNKDVLTFIGVGDGTFTAQKTVYTANWGAYSFTTGDFNGDGKPDILFADCCDPNTYYTGGYATVLFNQGGFNFKPNTDIGQVDFFNLVTTDFGHDGVDDFSLQFSGCHTPCAGIDVASGSRDGKLEHLLRLYINTDQQSAPAYARAGDFNGDGRDDLAYSMASNQGSGYPPVEAHASVLISLSDADGKVSDSPVDINVGPGQRSRYVMPMVAADFDNDGRPDIVVARPDQQDLVALLNTTGKSVSQGDFQLSITPGSATIARGQAASFALNVAPTNGFNAPVQLSCSGLPSGANCNFSANPVSTAGGAVNVNLNVTTTAPTTASNSSTPSTWVFALALPFGFVAVAGGFATRRRYAALLLLIALTVLIGLSACGGVSGSANNNNNNPQPAPGPTPTPGQGGTPAGTYTVTINAAAGSTQHSTKITLNVQ